VLHIREKSCVKTAHGEKFVMMNTKSCLVYFLSQGLAMNTGSPEIQHCASVSQVLRLQT
jgi:hypothetical protein